MAKDFSLTDTVSRIFFSVHLRWWCNNHLLIGHGMIQNIIQNKAYWPNAHLSDIPTVLINNIYYIIIIIINMVIRLQFKNLKNLVYNF